MKIFTRLLFCLFITLPQLLSAQTWQVQSDYFGERNTNASPRTIRSMALSHDGSAVYTGYIQSPNTGTTSLRKVSANVLATPGTDHAIFGNGMPGGTGDFAPVGGQPVYAGGTTGTFLGWRDTGNSPEGIATDDRGHVYVALSSGTSPANRVDIFSSDLSTTIGSITISGPAGVAVRKLGSIYYAYVAAGGQVRRWDVTTPATPTIDASWNPPGTAGAEGLEVDTDGTVFVAGGGVVRRISPDGTTITHTFTLANAADVAIFRNKIYVIRMVNPAPPIVVLNKIDLTSGGTDITVPELGAYTRGALSQFTAIDVSTDGKLFVSEENYTAGSNGISSYTPPVTSFNPTPGPITGRIYFDRVLISSPVEPTLISVNVTQPTCLLQTGTIAISATGIGVLEYSIDNGTNWSTNNTFSGLSPSSNHTVLVRSQSAPSGVTSYENNPVVIDAVPSFTPTFTAIGPLCEGSAPPTLQTISTNGITGTWSPATISTAAANVTTYTFTPDNGQCAVIATLSVTVNTLITPTFNAIGPLCQGETAPVLPATSTNGTTGTWSPATISTVSPNVTTYTFSPTGGQCPTSTTISVTVNAPVTPTFTAVEPLCQGVTPPVLPATSTNGIIGTWSPATISTTSVGTTTYTFTPTGGQCSISTTISVTVNPKPVVTLTVNGQTFNEGNNSVLCDTDANPVNTLTPNVTTSCIAGAVVWRTKIGAGDWSAWSTTAPSSQPSDNTAYQYQAACEGLCPATLTNPISLTINYRASTPQNVSLVADGTTVAAGESKTVCDAAGNTIVFNGTCAAGEILLYSVDGGDYSTTVPSQIVDGNFHNYRVRCRKADNTPSCVETESAVMSLKISTAPAAPTVSITPTDGCGAPVAFSGTSSCGALTTIWYNATTNEPLASLPAMTPNATTSYYARCQNDAGCLSDNSNTVTYTVTPINDAPVITVSSDMVCTGTQVTISANCPPGATAFWNTGVNENSFTVAFSNVTTQMYWAKCIFPNGCQSPESIHKSVLWKAFDLTFINIGQSQSGSKPANDKALWASQFITKDAGPVLENSTESNPTIYYSENVNKTAPRFWTIQVETCALGTDGSVTYDMLANPEVGVIRSYNTHENNAPYLMYANREGFTELYAQNHPAYGFYQDNGSGGNTYDAGLPKGLYKLSVRYWDQKGQGSIYPSTRQPAGNVLAYQEYWFRIQSQSGVGAGAARESAMSISAENSFAEVMPNPVSNTLRLKVNDAKGQKVNTTLVDASGRPLLQRSFVPQTNQHQEEFEVSQLTNGMYFIQVKTADKQTTLKVIKVE